MTCLTVGIWSRTFSKAVIKELSTMMTKSSAWLMMKANCSGKSRMLSVCKTAPMHGTAT